ncbi:hypothetical protein CANTEDRAFT_91972 [Yamadazyma tenuis ATCC 10573]|uniref:Zn(2)-C6 fungal-type domain-containing protein n=1 Tax=Candida tenuis (strain ATCC 10573 / BCRC 21748 / CBS 615 / JCM 9827 / NBRC 10315 / NRRL Y-1498 / VKM Y-70) TaxID=590646 RepID=G3AXN0_CANTC|nr:uncharacterized protein CANTEDRAFT_91972 [Yamadazyma tenuis ATCC 10573]EGV65655.1 hypothetical protein CANTEDRAFT_91972 [Yamadazyma tenuis ATCC 10573]
MTSQVALKSERISEPQADSKIKLSPSSSEHLPPRTTDDSPYPAPSSNTHGADATADATADANGSPDFPPGSPKPFVHVTGNQSRKRSKVSRACDACRRKKIKCNAQYSTSLQKVTQICTNCSKNQDECTFSRVPLKRGPSKGYIRDLEERAETKLTRNRIVLPPLGSANSGAALPTVNTPLSHSPLSSTPPQGLASGPFWKVPYEMPQGTGHHQNLSSSSSRRGSVDSAASSLSSVSGSGQRSRLPSINATDASMVSDSDDDFYSASSYRHSRRSSASLSPRNSVSSLSSLNGRILKVNLANGTNSPTASLPPVQQFHARSNSHPIMPPLNSPYTPPSPARTVPAGLDQDIKTYYAKFHPPFPILPFNETYILQVVESYAVNVKQDDPVISLFAQAIHQLINYQFVSINDTINLVYKISSIYPFSNFGIQLHDNVLVLFFSSLILVNYSVLLSGNIYSLSLSMTLSVFNDFKILENFNDLVATTSINSFDPGAVDNIKLYLPKLYLCLVVMDQFYALSFGIKTLVPPQNYGPLVSNLSLLIPADVSNRPLFQSVDLMADLLENRDKIIFKTGKDFKLSSDIWGRFNEAFNFNYHSNYHTLFLKLVKSKYESINFLIEIATLFRSDSFVSSSSSNEECQEVLNDHILKLVRLIKTLTTNLTSITDFINKSINKFELVQPVLNISINQIFKLIKLCKLVIDSLVQSVSGDLYHRIYKINSDLLSCFNNLNVILSLNMNVLSTSSLNLIKNKVSGFAMNFNFPTLAPNSSNNLMGWKYDLFSSILPFVEREDVDGWL